ncbi:Ger(x)C family spore germination protein [Psychrobacillus sp. MER TA 171]|uniref:Ger(x)C family spore germination protein n=1 Tax=Psychrobacillus sp. MER TA 171 TaxID=2939577 RepID=UPI00203CC29D|nr:Ger(x)C family spore germination protein [Psychrobacillus sp. MER TA 171]MCM3359216.1 Ger(x)C family spore germination protein [Psychrobacillus sp. MER TA 171]
MDKIKGLVILLVVCSFLAGCGFKDIDNRIFVTGIGIDPSEEDSDKYKVTLKLAIPVSSIKQEKEPSYQYLVHEGENLEDAIRILETHTDKVLEFGHAKVILINEKLLKEEIKDFMDYLFRRGDIQTIAWVGATKDSAEEILRTEPKGESAVASPLTKFFGNMGTESPYIVSKYLYEFRRDFYGEGIDVVLPIIESNEPGTQLIVNKSLIVREGKEPFELSSSQTRNFNALANNMGGYSFKIETEELNLSLNMREVKMKYKVLKEGDQPTSIKVDVTMAGVISQSNKRLYLDKLDNYNQLASIEIKKELEKLFTMLQEDKLDPFGFGLRYRTMQLYEKDIFKTWEKAYPELPIDLTVNISLKNTGTIQ